MNSSKPVRSKKALLVISCLVILFLISFTSSAIIYMRSKNLVFADNLKDVEELTQKLSENEDTIADLEEQLARYKTLYETAIRDASFTPASPSKTPTPSSKPSGSPKPTKTPETSTPKPTQPSETPEVSNPPIRTQSPVSTPSASQTPPPFVDTED